LCGDQQHRSFNKVKEVLTASPVLALFDPNLETVLSDAALLHGLGAVLLHRQTSRGLQPVAYISRAITPTTKRYAQIKSGISFHMGM
jgi:hypothetical protein